MNENIILSMPNNEDKSQLKGIFKPEVNPNRYIYIYMSIKT